MNSPALRFNLFARQKGEQKGFSLLSGLFYSAFSSLQHSVSLLHQII
jgi:hypothetical protein